MTSGKVLLVCAWVVFCFACDDPREQQVKNAFRAANPNSKPVSVVGGEGNSDSGYFHIKYKKPDDKQTYEQIWLYQRQEDGTFKIVSKEREKVIE